MADSTQNLPVDWPFRASIARQATGRGMLCIPWSNTPAELGAPFSSKQISSVKGPLLSQTPFSKGDLVKAPLVYTAAPSAGTFQERTSTFNSNSSEHFSVGFGVTVGCPFLSGSVSGRYDQTLLENNDSCKTSQSVSIRRGSLLFEHDPVLSADALGILEKGGISAFQSTYGDFYVAGVNIGADSGLCVSFSTESLQKADSYSITISAKIIFFTVSHTWSHEEIETFRDVKMSINGFNTLENEHVNISSVAETGLEKLRQSASELAAKNGSLDADVGHLIQDYSLSDGKAVGNGDFGKICASGLVVELVLAPYSSLREVAQYHSI